MNASNFTSERLSSRGSMEFASNVLFVGDLASFCTEAHIESIFRNEGFRIVDAKLIRGRQSALSLNYGFVQMRTAEEAMGAIAALDNRLFYGRTIRVSWAKPNSKGSKSHDIVNSIHVKFQALIVSNFLSNENDIYFNLKYHKICLSLH
jgi:RNA recognition motif-containing protein